MVLGLIFRRIGKGGGRVGLGELALDDQPLGLLFGDLAVTRLDHTSSLPARGAAIIFRWKHRKHFDAGAGRYLNYGSNHDNSGHININNSLVSRAVTCLDRTISLPDLRAAGIL